MKALRNVENLAATLEEEAKTLYQHKRHPHIPRDINKVHKAELQQSVNARIAVTITRATGTMACAYIFTLLAIIGLFGLLGWLNPFTFLLATWISQQFLQLVFLPILSVGQGVLTRKQELQAQEQFETSQHSFYDIEQIMVHLDKQDEAILAILEKITTSGGVEVGSGKQEQGPK